MTTTTTEQTTTTTADPATTTASSADPASAGLSFDSWKAGLPEDQRNYIEANGYSDFSHLLVSDMGAIKKLGRPASDLIIKPKGDFAENRDGYLEAMRALGAPADKAGYGEAPELDGLGFKDGAWDKLTDLFAQNGVPSFLVKPVLEGISGIVKGEQDGRSPEEISAARRQENMDALRGAHGAKADAMVANAQALLKQKGEDGFLTFLEESGFGNDPRMIAFLSKLHADYAESGLLERNGGNGDPVAMSVAQAQEEIRKLEGDPQFMKQLQSPMDANHKQAVARRNELYAIAYPGGR